MTVIDRTNQHLFQPPLYQVATAGLAAPAIAAPVRHVPARQKNATVLMAHVVGIDTGARTVQLDDGQHIPYVELIVATGATHSDFGHDEWQAHAPGLKTLEDAFDIRRRILVAFEQAEREPVDAARAAWLTFVVIGAGATGVEMAGMLAEIARRTLNGEFRRFDSRSARVILLEGGPRVLPAFPEDLSARARAQLERLGVIVWLDSRVTAIDRRGVEIGGTRIDARTVIRAAGVEAPPRSRWAAMPRATSCAGCAANRRGRSAIATTARWPRSAARPPSRSSARSSCRAIRRA